LGKSRQPFQAGAEMYGHAGLEADIEIQQLMVDVLRALGVNDLQLDIGHPAIFRSLIASANVSPGVAEQAFLATEAKDIPALKAMEAALGESYQAISALPMLYGDVSTLARAAELLPKHAVVADALAQLLVIEKHFAQQRITVSIDLGELGGFNYESGITFAAFARGASDAVARGGRYDEVGKAFGRARPATGFSMDLKAILPLVADEAVRGAILAPMQPDLAARAEIARLRASGEVVIADLAGHDTHLSELGCDRRLSFIDGHWTTVPLT
jgi:ATP phosphoribosyltransferase regulatory subunit